MLGNQRHLSLRDEEYDEGCDAFGIFSIVYESFQAFLCFE